MKNFKSIIKSGLLMCALLMGLTLLANEGANPFDIEVNTGTNLVDEENFIGNWKYSSENVPYEYANGILFISKKEGQLIVVVALAGGERNAQDVKVKENTLTFTLNLEGRLVSINMVLDGDKISGKASSEDGVFKLTGERRLDPE